MSKYDYGFTGNNTPDGKEVGEVNNRTFTTIFATLSTTIARVQREINQPGRSQDPFVRWVVDNGKASVFPPLGSTVDASTTNTARILVPTREASSLARALATVPGVSNVRRVSELAPN